MARCKGNAPFSTESCRSCKLLRLSVWQLSQHLREQPFHRLRSMQQLARPQLCKSVLHTTSIAQPSIGVSRVTTLTSSLQLSNSKQEKPRTPTDYFAFVIVIFRLVVKLFPPCNARKPCKTPKLVKLAHSPGQHVSSPATTHAFRHILSWGQAGEIIGQAISTEVARNKRPAGIATATTTATIATTIGTKSHAVS